MARFKAPDWMTGVSVGGVEYPVVEGVIDAPDEVAAALAELGAVPFGDEAPDEVAAYTVKHRGFGSWSVMLGDKEVVEKLTKAEAEAFAALDDVAKAQAVEYALAVKGV